MVGWDRGGTLWGRLTPTVSGAPEVVRGRKAAGRTRRAFTRDKLSCRTGSPHQRGRGRSIRASRGLPSAHISWEHQGQRGRRRGRRAEGQGRGRALRRQHLTCWRNEARGSSLRSCDCRSLVTSCCGRCVRKKRALYKRERWGATQGETETHSHPQRSQIITIIIICA